MARHCTGQLTLTANRDSFSSGDGLYQANANCSWHLAPPEPNRQVQLFFSSFHGRFMTGPQPLGDGDQAACHGSFMSMTSR